MIYYASKKKSKIKKYRTHISQNNQNYSILHYVYQNKLQISLKYSDINSDEIFDYTNFYSYHQLQIINKYFRYFDNLEQICCDLYKLLKNNIVSIEEKIGFVILSITVLIKNESSNIIFKLLQNKITDFHGRTNKLKAPYNYKNHKHYNKEINNNSLSMPKYKENKEKEFKNYFDDLKDKDSILESNHHKSESQPKEITGKNNININNDKNILNNINSILTKINKLEQENKEKDIKIKEIEDELSKCEQNINNTMSYPLYSIANESQKSENEMNNEDDDNIKKNNLNEFKFYSHLDNHNVKNEKLENKKIIDIKKENINQNYAFKQIEENKERRSKDNNKSIKKKHLNESFKDESSKDLKKAKLKNISKSQANLKKRKNSNSIALKEEEENNDNNIKTLNHKHDSYNNKIKENKNKNLDENLKKEEETLSEVFSNNKSKNTIKSDKKQKNNQRRNSNNSNISLKDNNNSNLSKEKYYNKKGNKNFDKTRTNYSNISSEEKKKNLKRKPNDNLDISSEEKDKKKKRKKKEKDSMSSEEKDNKEKFITKKNNNKRKMAENGLSMVEREDLKKYINSRIFFTKRELQMIKNRVVKEEKHLHSYFDLLYRASIDGDYEEKIISLCEGQYPQLILFYTKEGARFGVYIEKEKNINFFGKLTYKEIQSTSFLFSLNSLTIYDIQNGKKATDDMDEKLCFGRSFYYNENETNWLIYTPKNNFLNLKLKIGEKESNFGIIDINQIVGVNKDYHLKDVEIFKVKVYPNEIDYEEDEKNK